MSGCVISTESTSKQPLLSSINTEEYPAPIDVIFVESKLDHKIEYELSKSTTFA